MSDNFFLYMHHGSLLLDKGGSKQFGNQDWSRGCKSPAMEAGGRDHSGWSSTRVIQLPIKENLILGVANLAHRYVFISRFRQLTVPQGKALVFCDRHRSLCSHVTARCSPNFPDSEYAGQHFSPDAGDNPAHPPCLQEGRGLHPGGEN